MNTPVSLKIQRILLKKGINMPVRTTIADVVMWLYKNHRIWIEVTMDANEKFCWASRQFRACNNNLDSPEEAYDAAFEYVLENRV